MDFIEGKKQHQQQQSLKSSRSATPEPAGDVSPCYDDGDESPCYDDYRPLMRTPPPTRAGPPPSPPVPTHPRAPVDPEPSGLQTLSPCPVCARTFLPPSLAIHIRICEKMTVKKRKTFDSSRQRRVGTDLEQYLPKNFGLPENCPFLEKSPPPTAKPTPKPKLQSVRQSITKVRSKSTADLQKCPHCCRNFCVRAFERHVEWCADKAKILPAAPAQPPQHLADAMQRLNARTQYKAPPVKGRRSSQTRDKSSNSRSASVQSSRGVSPSRETGDYRHRTRASESGSSNDCHEDASPHVPVIRNSRLSQNNSSGDANVKARQARLARDLTNTRLDDNYDPFASAARQMKELMSSDSTTMSKKNSHSNKDLSRTLPILRQKEKGPATYNNSNNTKLMKDTLNKSYQKTPTLQRMKSFGSTNDNNTSFGSRCSSFRLRNDKQKSSQNKLNTTFTKSSKENVSTVDKSYFSRNSNLNRSFSSYTASSYSTPKPRDKIPKIATSMYHSFQRTTIKQPVKLDKIKKDDEKKDYVSLDAILADDNSSMTDSNYIDPRLINANDNLPINVNTILNNPDIISSMESLLTTENLPAKFESFSSSNLNINNNKNRNGIIESSHKLDKIEHNNNLNNKITPTNNHFDTQYDKLISSMEQSLTSKTSIRDDESLCEDFDLEEFMTTFDEEIIKHKLENKRTCSSTTRVVKQSGLSDSNRNSEFNSKCSSPNIMNGMHPVNKSMSLTFSSNNIVNENLFPSCVKRSTSLLDSIQKKSVQKVDSTKNRHNVDQLEQDLMQSLKDFDKMYVSEKKDHHSSKESIKYDHHSSKESIRYNGVTRNGTARRDSRAKIERKLKKEDVSNGNFTPNGKDSAYSSLNRISPSKLSLCTSKEPNGRPSIDAAPVSDSSSHKDDARSLSSEEFLAMERSTELDEPSPQDIHPPFQETESLTINEKRVSSRASSRRSPTWQPHCELSSSSSEASLHPGRTAPQLSRFCHECGTRYPVDIAKFCIECGVKRLFV